MGYELKTINPLLEPRWDRLLLSTAQYSFFHSSAWARVLSDSYNYTPRYFTVIPDEKILIAIPCMEIKSPFTGNRGVSLPFSDYCDPIVPESTDADEIFRSLINRGKEAGWKYLELRKSSHFPENQNSSKEFYHHVLRLDSNENEVYAKFRNSTRRNIEKAVRQGVKIKIGRSAEDLDQYYHLHCTTRKFHGLPPQPEYFFHNIFKHVLSNDLGMIVLAKINDRCIAGNVYFHLGKKAYYKYGASDRNYQQYRASNLVMWEALRYYCANSFESLCFGRTDIDDDGLMQFKNGWGADCTRIKYYRYDLLNDRFVAENHGTHHAVTRIFRHLPVSLLRIIGILLYRHLG